MVSIFERDFLKFTLFQKTYAQQIKDGPLLE